MNQNNVKHLVGFLYFVFYTFSRLFSKKNPGGNLSRVD